MKKKLKTIGLFCSLATISLITSNITAHANVDSENFNMTNEDKIENLTATISDIEFIGDGTGILHFKLNTGEQTVAMKAIELLDISVGETFPAQVEILPLGIVIWVTVRVAINLVVGTQKAHAPGMPDLDIPPKP